MSRRVDRAIVAVTIEGFLSRLSFGLVNLAVPLYALALHLDLTMIGILTSVNVVVQIVLKPLMGAVTDRIGPRRSLLWAIALRSLVPLAFVFARVPWQLFAIRLLYGFAQAWRDPALNSIMADAGGKKKVASAFAWYHTAKNTASSIGRAVAGVLISLTAANYPLVFAVGFVLSVLPLVVVVRALPADRALRGAGVAPVAAATAAAEPEPEPVAVAGPRPRVWPFSALGFLYGLTAGMFGLFPVIAKEYLGLSAAAIGVSMLVSTVAIVLAGPLFGWLADNVSRNLVLMVRAVANTCSALLLLVVRAPFLVGAAKAFDDVGKAAFRPAWGSIMAEVSASDRSRRARTMSLIDVGEDAGDAAGPILAGWLLASFGLPAMLLTRVALAAVTELATWRLTHTRRHASDARPVDAAVPPDTAAAAPGDLAPLVWTITEADRVIGRVRYGVDVQPVAASGRPCRPPALRPLPPPHHPAARRLPAPLPPPVPTHRRAEA